MVSVLLIILFVVWISSGITIFIATSGYNKSCKYSWIKNYFIIMGWPLWIAYIVNKGW